MRLVAIESPYAALPHTSVADHEEYARFAMADSLACGEAPFVSHLLYTQVLADTVAAERTKGMAAGIAWSRKADFAAFYCDLGITPGMLEARIAYIAEGIGYELRRLFPRDVSMKVQTGKMTLRQAARMARTAWLQGQRT